MPTNNPPHTAISAAILTVKGIEKSFPGVRALDGVDFEIHPGKLNALVGENGAGKSTLMNILAGVLQPDSGEILLDGQLVSFTNTKDAQRAGIAMIYQELNLVPYLTIAENIFLGREPVNKAGVIDYQRMNMDSANLLSQLDLRVDPTVLVGELRVGQQQVVEIAKALSLDARIIIMDEPTSAITEHEIDVLFRLIDSLKAKGVALVYITHKLDELFRIGDRVTVLRDGQYIDTKPIDALDQDEVVRMMVGRELKGLYSRTPAIAEKEVLRVERITLRHPVQAHRLILDEVSLNVKAGEILGLFGLMGAGRTELLETIFGLHPDDCEGAVYIEGAPITIDCPADAIAAGIGLAPEDRKDLGLVLPMSVEANASLAALKRIQRFAFVPTQSEGELAQKYVQRLRIKTPSLVQAVQNLSGGNQQKVILAKWLATDPKVLLLDEPSRGIDINAKREIYTLVDELTKSGLGIVMVSSELPETLAVADRVVVLCEGKLTAEFTRAEATEEKILNAAISSVAPTPVTSG